MSSISEDGINFEIEESRLQSKNDSFKVLGAPRVIRDNNGSIKLFAKAGEKASDGIAAFISYDDEFTYQEEKMVANHQELGLEKASKFTPIKIDGHKYQSYAADGATTDRKSFGKRKITGLPTAIALTKRNGNIHDRTYAHGYDLHIHVCTDTGKLALA